MEDKWNARCKIERQVHLTRQGQVLIEDHSTITMEFNKLFELALVVCGGPNLIVKSCYISM